jgi:RNA polymerase sigma-70 factor (ECF subfamily)
VTRDGVLGYLISALRDDSERGEAGARDCNRKEMKDGGGMARALPPASFSTHPAPPTISAVEKDERERDLGRGRPQRFETTRWGLVLAARGGTPEAREALAELCGLYWYPLYAFVRRKGRDEHEAGDLVQGFFARLLEKEDIAAADPARGKFRSFLMAACAHYTANRDDHERAAKRGGGRPVVAIDRGEAEGRYAQEPAHEMTAERLFERRWALTLLGRVLERLEFDMARSGKSRQFEALRPALLGEGDRLPFAEVAGVLGITEEAARAAAHRLRKRYREILREEVARTVGDGDEGEVEEELRALFETLAG